eukprot:TRINITY_DN13099_c1_g2_i1.p1 TRINITY_DN13099_c1_g2~~TRINITY_DN13099_c1_g2_i1.p1  ORF type:complete len:432 (-),score=109.51 TRINITY_DN13099_c1_g2_i1:51-1346(-)
MQSKAPVQPVGDSFPQQSPRAKASHQQCRGVHAVDWCVLREIREQLGKRVLCQGYEITEDEGVVSCEELTSCWLVVAGAEQQRQGCGPLTERDKEFIEVRVSQSMREVDPKCTNMVDRDEWVHHMLLTRSSPKTMKAVMQISALLEAALERCPGILVGLQHAYEVAQQNALEKLGKDAADPMPEDCKMPLADILDVYSRKLWHLRPMGKSAPDFSGATTGDFIDESMKAMDLDREVRICYADFLALCLGRRERDVTLHLYDLSRGIAPILGPLVVDEDIQGVWHTGVVVFGKEYYFGGDIYFDTPAETGFGPPRRAIHLGTTLRHREELHAFIVDELKPSFSREAYDAARNNCNHFTDRLALFLVGKHIPEEILAQPQLMMNTALGRALRPVLTKLLGVYFEPPKSAEEVSYAAKVGREDHTLNSRMTFSL